MLFSLLPHKNTCAPAFRYADLPMELQRQVADQIDDLPTFANLLMVDKKRSALFTRTELAKRVSAFHLSLPADCRPVPWLAGRVAKTKRFESYASRQPMRHGVNEIDASPDGRFVFGRRYASTSDLWDLRTGSHHALRAWIPTSDWSAKFSADNRYMVAGERTLWDLAGKKPTRHLLECPTYFAWLRFSSDSQHLHIATTYTREWFTWSLPSGRCVRVEQAPKACNADDAYFMGDGRYVFSHKEGVFVGRPEAGAVESFLPHIAPGRHQFYRLVDENMLFVVPVEGPQCAPEARSWVLDLTHEAGRVIEGAFDWARGRIEFAANGRVAVTGFYSEHLRFWQLNTPLPTLRCDHPRPAPVQAAVARIAPDGLSVVLATREEKLLHWKPLENLCRPVVAPRTVNIDYFDGRFVIAKRGWNLERTSPRVIDLRAQSLA